MSGLPRIDFETVWRLAGASAGLVLLAKWTLVLALAWLAHAGLSRRDPRWRVVLWRGALAGVALVAGLALAPPFVNVSFRPEARPAPVPPLEDVAAVPSTRRDLAPRTVSGPPAAPTRTGRHDSSVLIAYPDHLTVAAPPSRHKAMGPASSPAPLVFDGETWLARRWALACAWAPRIWIVGALIFGVRLVLAWLALGRLVRRSEAAPEAISRECRAVAERLGIGRAVRVARSSEVLAPCLAGLARPVLLLPARDFAPEVMRSILAHELAHARHHDLAWNLVAHLIAIGLWFHPLAWRIRSAHAAACDAVSDAVAADFLGDVALYARALARLALDASGRELAHALAMARSSEVWRRLDALNRQVFGRPLARRSLLPALAIVGALVVLIGGLGVTQARQEPAKPAAKAPKAKPGRLELRAVEATTGEPVDGVTIAYQMRIGGNLHNATVTTAENGAAAIEWKAGEKMDWLRFTARKPKLVPIHARWSGDKHPIQLPASKELRFEPGTTIGGIVQDEAGRPISGATVTVYAPATKSDMTNYVFDLGTPQTDEQGRWQLDVAPRDLAYVSTNVTHPGFRRGGGAASHNLNSVVVLEKGITLKGRALDSTNKPIQGARVLLGHDRWGTNPPTATTNERGEFVLKNCEAGASMITVQAKGLAPHLQNVIVEKKQAKPVEVRMAGPGATLRVRLVDVNGKPVIGAHFVADTWRGHRTLEFRTGTDQDGRATWSDAPRDEVLYDFVKSGYMPNRKLPLTASDREQTIALHPPLVISGKVTDAATGRPIDRFRVVQGVRFAGDSRIFWSEEEAADGANGQYISKFTEPRDALFVRIEAPGRAPVDSRPFRSDEGAQSFDIALKIAKPEDEIAGTVELPDGQPAAGAEIALGVRLGMVLLRSGRLSQENNYAHTATDAHGRFAFKRPRHDQVLLLVALADAGYADASADEFAKTHKLVLRPWGKVDGGLRIGARTGAHQTVSFQPDRPHEDGWAHLSHSYSTTTDERGRFLFERVVPGPGTVSRPVTTRYANGTSTDLPCWQVAVDVPPGQTATATIGGKGRPVVGRAVLDGVPDRPIDWARNAPARLLVSTGERDKAGDARRSHAPFAANIDQDGRFRIEDVPAGRYELAIDVSANTDGFRPGWANLLGRITVPVTVPEMPGGRSNEPLDLGDVAVKLFETLKIGDPAPDFKARRVDNEKAGEPLTLSDYQGKLIFLHCWDWQGRRSASGDMAALKDLYAAFGKNARFQMIGLSCDWSRISTMAFLRRDPIPWPQVHIGGLQSGIAANYKLRSVSSSFLVGPDGRILAKNLEGRELKGAIARALKNDALFKTKTWDHPTGRFPVTRFEVQGRTIEQDQAAKPLVVVLDDCDPSSEPGRPHRDALRILRTKDGAADPNAVEESSFPEFHTGFVVGGIHTIALDRARGRIYLREVVARSVVALDFQGRKLWRVDGIDGGALALDPGTGNLWCTVGQGLDEGETVVLSPEGREVASHPAYGTDIAYDPHTDAFWLAGYEDNGLTKLSREGKVLFQKPWDGYLLSSVAVDPRDGSVWTVERDHPTVPHSANRLWHLSSDGKLIKNWPLGDKQIYGVAVSPKDGTAWASVLVPGEVLRFTADGRELPPLPYNAVAVAIGPTTGRTWLTTRADPNGVDPARPEIIELDESDKPLVRAPLGPQSRQSWLAVY